MLTKGRVPKKNPAYYPLFVDKGGGSPNVDKRGGEGGSLHVDKKIP